MCEHMNDVTSDVARALEMAGIEVKWESWEDLNRALSKMGVTPLFGGSLNDEAET